MTKRQQAKTAWVICGVCAAREPVATAHEHHRVPRAFGGTDDLENRVWLCASDHNRLHRVAGLIAQGNIVEAYQLCQALFAVDAQQRGNLWVLAQLAAKSELDTKESFAQHRDTVRISLEVDYDVWAQVKAAAKRQKCTAAQLGARLITSGISNHT